MHVADLDVTASYPNGEVAFNISKKTTLKELCFIEGVDEVSRRQQGINLSGGQTNAIEFVQVMFSAPTHAQLLAGFREDRAKSLAEKQQIAA